MRPWRVPFPKFGHGPGLERVQTVAAELGVDLAAFGANAAVITGSNGKGSTAAMCASLLAQACAPVGLFTSPHLFDLNERFRIGDEDISDDELSHHWAHVLDAIEKAGVPAGMGGFEFLFLIAADWFAARGCAATVWEAGIGGRLDPVRLIQAKRTALTSLDLEHTEILGDTLEAIAADKIDAAPSGATIFVGERCAPHFVAIERFAANDGRTAILVRADEIGAAPLPLPGAHQRANAALALRLARDIAPLTDVQVAEGFAATRWPGRLEMINADPLIVIDVGHTPDGVRAALDGFSQMRGARDALLVCGVSADKDVSAIVSALAPAFPTIVAASARHKGAPSAAIAAAAQAANPGAEIAVAASVEEARQVALALARARGAAIYVAGGLFLAAEFKAAHLGRDPASLAFF